MGIAYISNMNMLSKFLLSLLIFLVISLPSFAEEVYFHSFKTTIPPETLKKLILINPELAFFVRTAQDQELWEIVRKPQNQRLQEIKRDTVDMENAEAMGVPAPDPSAGALASIPCVDELFKDWWINRLVDECRSPDRLRPAEIMKRMMATGGPKDLGTLIAEKRGQVSSDLRDYFPSVGITFPGVKLTVGAPGEVPDKPLGDLLDKAEKWLRDAVGGTPGDSGTPPSTSGTQGLPDSQGTTPDPADPSAGGPAGNDPSGLGDYTPEDPDTAVSQPAPDGASPGGGGPEVNVQCGGRLMGSPERPKPSDILSGRGPNPRPVDPLDGSDGETTTSCFSPELTVTIEPVSVLDRCGRQGPVSNPGDTGHDPCESIVATIVIQTWDGVIAKINLPIDPLRLDPLR